GDRFTLPARLALVAGRLQSNPAGYAFCVTDDPEEEDIYVPASAVRPAMHGDRVLVRVERFQRRGRTEGRVARVLERGTSRVIGVLRRGRTSAVVVPQEQRITVPLVVPRGADGGAADGDMVVADLVRWPGLASEAEARVTAVLGPATDPRVETEAVIAAHDLPRDFPPEAAAAARRVPSSVPASATAGRLDLRGLPIVTIDGENARDFDDAVLVEPLGTGFRLTVAVADVAHYVPAGSPLDLEARARGTSVYFPDRVLPMLPEELSNGICSLRPDEDRLVKAVRLELDARERGRRKLGFLHRVHEPPTAESVGELARFLEGFGLRLRVEAGRANPKAFAAVLEQVKGRAEERLVNTILLRSMQQARYAAEALGHFGLATDCYTHFTSPIRRYPDLVVHRILGTGRVPPDLGTVAEESSRKERVAMEAEREIVELKKVQFMQDKVGEAYDGFVSGVVPFGFFVELKDVFIEGLVHLSALGDDF